MRTQDEVLASLPLEKQVIYLCQFLNRLMDQRLKEKVGSARCNALETVSGDVVIAIMSRAKLLPMVSVSDEPPGTDILLPKPKPKKSKGRRR